MFRPLVPDRKLTQQRRNIIDEEFKKEKVELSKTAVTEVIRPSKTKRLSSVRRK